MIIRACSLALFGSVLLAVAATLPASPAAEAAHPGAPAHPPVPAAESERDADGIDIESPIPMKLADFKTDLALWTGVVFVMLFLLLAKFAWKPLAQGLDKREQGVADQIAQAEDANRQAKDLLGAYEKRLAQAGEEVRAMTEQGRRDAEQAGQELIEKARAEAKIEQARTLRQIEAAEAAALKSLADRGASLALELAGKIVHAKLSRKDHEKLIEQAVARFAESAPGTTEVSRN